MTLNPLSALWYAHSKYFTKRNEPFEMEKESKVKQIVVRFDTCSYDKISAFAKAEHRGLGEFVRHAALHYIEHLDKARDVLNDERGK